MCYHMLEDQSRSDLKEEEKAMRQSRVEIIRE